MAETPITRRDADKTWDRPTEAHHKFVLRMFRGYVLEVEDVHFHHDSAVLLPDYGSCEVPHDPAEPYHITGLAVLCACYRHAEEHPAQKLIIMGHTDRSGPPDYNLRLSKMRADNVLHVLLGEREQWVEICRNKHKVEDYQQILKWVDSIWAWGCDPGPVDNIRGPKTRAGTKVFQQVYNVEFGKNIDTDGVVGRQTWGAFFDVYVRVLKFLTERDEAGLESLRRSLDTKFLDPGRKAVGCGENFPITPERKENYRSPIDRRVEILFFDPGEEPSLDCHPGPGVCESEKCKIYDDKLYRFKPIPCRPLVPVVAQWVLRILKAGPGPLSQREPVKNEDYVVTGVDGAGGERRGKTDENGVLRITVDADPTTMELRIAGGKITLEAGMLPKIEEAGDEPVKRRLYNLGYGKDKYADWDADTLTGALKTFQKEHGLSETGVADETTRSRLKEAHGS